MRLIVSALLLAFAIFFTTIEPSSQSSLSHSKQGSNRRVSGQQGNSRRPSYSVESEASVESRFTGVPRTPKRRTQHLDRSSLREEQEVTSRYSGHSEQYPQNSRHPGPRIIYQNSGSSSDSSPPRSVGSSRSNSPSEQRYSSHSERSQFVGHGQQSVSSMMPTPPHPYSPSGPFSYQYNSPSETSGSSFHNASPYNNRYHSP